MRKTIHQLFRGYGFYPCQEGYVRAYNDKLCTTIRINIPEEHRHKDIKMIERYKKEGTLEVTAKNMFGDCQVPFIGFMQHMMGFKKKECNKFAPSAIHCQEMGKYMSRDSLTQVPY